MTYTDAFILSNSHTINGFVKCTYVELYDKDDNYLYTVKASYADYPNLAFLRQDNGKIFSSLSMLSVPFCRAYDFVRSDNPKQRVPVMLSEEFKYVMQQKIFQSQKAKEPYRLIKEYFQNWKGHKKGDRVELTQAYEPPLMKGHENGRWGTKDGKTVLIVKTVSSGGKTLYSEYWVYPEYEYVFEDRYLALLEIAEKNEPVYIKQSAVWWLPDAMVLTTIEDPILLDDKGELITNENGEPVVLYDDNGNIIPTDENGKPLIPETAEVQYAQEIEAARKKVEQAKTLLAAAGAVAIL